MRWVSILLRPYLDVERGEQSGLDRSGSSSMRVASLGSSSRRVGLLPCWAVSLAGALSCVVTVWRSA